MATLVVPYCSCVQGLELLLILLNGDYGLLSYALYSMYPLPSNQRLVSHDMADIVGLQGSSALIGRLSQLQVPACRAAKGQISEFMVGQLLQVFLSAIATCLFERVDEC